MKQKTNMLTKAGVLFIAVAMLLSALPVISADTISTEEDPITIQMPSVKVINPGTYAYIDNEETGSMAIGADAFIGYNDGYTENAISWGDPMIIGIELTSTELTGYYGDDITDIRLCVGSDDYGFYVETFEVFLTTTLPAIPLTGTPVYSGISSGTGWDTVALTTPWTIPASGSVFVTISFPGYTDYPAGLDESTTSPLRGGLIVNPNDNTWTDIITEGAPGVWGIDIGVTAGGGPGPGPGGEECIEDACDFEIEQEYGFCPEFLAMSNYDEILDTFYWNSLPKTLQFNIANKGEIGISELKFLVDIYEKICGPTTEVWCDEKYDIQQFDVTPSYPYTFEDWQIIDDLDGDSWVLQGGADNRWLTNNQAWRCTAGEDRSYGDDADVYLGKNDNPLATGVTDDLITPGFDIAGAACAEFSFSHWAEGEYTIDDNGNIVPVDYGTIAYSLNGGVNWTELTFSDFLAYDTADEWVDVNLKFINTCIDADDADYMHPYATICDDCAPEDGDILIEDCFPADAELMVKFMWHKDPCLQFEGWYIDNVCVHRTEDYDLELVYQGHIIMELDPCVDNVTWECVDFPIDWDPKPDTWYELWAHGQVFSPIGCEDDTLNNWFKTQFKIVDVHDMACVGMELIDPEDGVTTSGSSVLVNVTVKNLGSFTESNVPVDLWVGDKVVDSLIKTDFETDPGGLFNAYYFVGGSGDVPFRWTAGDSSIDNIYEMDPAQARSKLPGRESYICAEEGTMPYLAEDTGCYIEIPGIIDLDRNDNGVQDYGDPAHAYLKFNAKWSMEYPTYGSDARLGISFTEGAAAGGTWLVSFGIGDSGDPYRYQNDWQAFDIDLYEQIDELLTNAGYADDYDYIPAFNIGFIVIADGIGMNSWGSTPNGGTGNSMNPIPWSGFMIDRLECSLVEIDEGSLEKVNTATTGSVPPNAEETVQITWNNAELCNHGLIADVNADDDVNPNNDRCFVQVNVVDEEYCFEGGSVDLTSQQDCLWHVCTNRENGDDYFAWTGIVEETWAHYINNMDDSMISPLFNITGFVDEGVSLNFTTYYELMPGDFGEVSVFKDGEWHFLKKFTGSSEGGFKDVGIPIPEDLCSDFMKFKFRFVSNDEGVSEGWFFDDLYIHDLTDDGVSGTLADNWVGYSDLYCENAISWGDPMIIGIELTSAELTSYYGQDITDLYLCVGSDDYGFYSNAYELFITTSQPSIPLTGTPTDTGTSSSSGWTSKVLGTPWTIPASGSVFVTISFPGYTDYPAGLDESTTSPLRGGLIVDPNDNTWTDIITEGAPGVWGIDIGVTAGTANVVYGNILDAVMWLDPEGDNAYPHATYEDFERGVIDPWICDPSYGGNFWQKTTDNTTLPNAEDAYDYDECDECLNGFYVIEGYPESGSGINNAYWFELDLTDPNLIYAKLGFMMDYDLDQETIYIEFSPDWEPGTDMDEATWTPYFVHTPGDNYGDNTLAEYGEEWVHIDTIVGDDRFVIDEYLTNTVYVRFRMTTEGDGAGTGDGWAIDGLTLSVKRLDGPVIEDTEPPVTSIFFNSDNGQVTLVAVDYPLNKNVGVDKTYYIIDDGAQTDYTGPFTIGEGTHTVQYWSVDNRGNTEGKNTATYTVDTSEPTVELTSPEAGIYFLGNKLLNFGSKAICIGKVPIAADADDGTGSGIARVLFDVNGDTGYDSEAPYEYVFRGMNFGSLTIKATAIDNAGLMSDPAEMTITCFSLGLL
jgi:hypothetical protein